MGTAAQLVEVFDRVDSSTPGAARRAVIDFARERIANPETLDAIALCVSEAITNIVVHAYRGHDGPGCAIVEASFEDPETFRVVVGDRGTGMAPRVDSPGLGLGLPLIAGLCDASHFQARRGGGTEICMRFGTGARPGAADATG